MGASRLPHDATDVSPSGFRGPRGAILTELKRAGSTARELAVRLGVSLNAVRHHLKELEAEGLVQYERSHRGVGAPAFVYLLSPAGERLFPRRYKEALEQLLEFLVARDGRAAAVAALESHFDALRMKLQAQLADASPSERMDALVQALSEAGYMAEGQASFCCGNLIERNCAIRDVAEQFPELCAAEERFLAAVLGGTVERKRHMLGGCGACEYNVQFPQERV